MNNSLLPIDRFLHTLEIVAREGDHLVYSWRGLYSQNIDADWVRSLDNAPDQAVWLEAFISRFGRIQDTMADKLLPRWLMALAEKPGSQIETLNRAEKLGVLNSVEDWLEARKLRNKLVHEYMENPVDFAEYLVLAKTYTLLLIECFNRMIEYCVQHMGIKGNTLPKKITATI